MFNSLVIVEWLAARGFADRAFIVRARLGICTGYYATGSAVENSGRNCPVLNVMAFWFSRR
jgi:hypothetical protein